MIGTSHQGGGGVSLDTTIEFERLNALRRYAILDTPPEGVFDRITALAAEMLEVPVAVVSLVDTNRVWYKSVHGPLPEREMRRLPGLCGAAVLHDGPYVVESARADPRTQEHPLVAGPFGLDFYVGVPLRTHDGHALGLLSCMDTPAARPDAARDALPRGAGGDRDGRDRAPALGEPDLAAERGAGRDLRRPRAARELRPADRGAGALDAARRAARACSSGRPRATRARRC